MNANSPAMANHSNRKFIRNQWLRFRLRCRRSFILTAFEWVHHECVMWYYPEGFNLVFNTISFQHLNYRTESGISMHQCWRRCFSIAAKPIRGVKHSRHKQVCTHIKIYCTKNCLLWFSLNKFPLNTSVRLSWRSITFQLNRSHIHRVCTAIRRIYAYHRYSAARTFTQIHTPTHTHAPNPHRRW